MKAPDFIRYALTGCVATAMLAGCGGSQPPIGASGAMSQTLAVATQADRGTSWIAPAKSSGALIYAVGGCGGTCVVSNPAGELVGTLPTGGAGICSDSGGNVFIADDNNVVEYAHGGTSPIATLSLPGDDAAGCSVDPTTRNLAVVFVGSGGDIAIFADAAGMPTLYNSGLESLYCGYDNNGNLFVDGFSGGQPGFAELLNGATDFTKLTISDSIGEPGQVQWDGKYITYEALGPKYPKIHRLTVSGSAATIIGTTSFKNVQHMAHASWIFGDKIILPYPIRGPRANVLGIWKYPKGGKATDTIRRFGSYKKKTIDFQAVTLSVQP